MGMHWQSVISRRPWCKRHYEASSPHQGSGVVRRGSCKLGLFIFQGPYTVLQPGYLLPEAFLTREEGRRGFLNRGHMRSTHARGT